MLTKRKLFNLACRYWQLSPDVLREKMASGDILLEDVMGLLEVLSLDMNLNENLREYLKSDEERALDEEFKRRKAEVDDLNQKLQIVQNLPDSAVKQEQLDFIINKLNEFTEWCKNNYGEK